MADGLLGRLGVEEGVKEAAKEAAEEKEKEAKAAKEEEKEEEAKAKAAKGAKEEEKGAEVRSRLQVQPDRELGKAEAQALMAAAAAQRVFTKEELSVLQVADRLRESVQQTKASFLQQVWAHAQWGRTVHYLEMEQPRDHAFWAEVLASVAELRERTLAKAQQQMPEGQGGKTGGIRHGAGGASGTELGVGAAGGANLGTPRSSGHHRSNSYGISKEQLRQKQLIAFYQKHNPAKIAETEDLLKKYPLTAIKHSLYEVYGELPDGEGWEPLPSTPNVSVSERAKEQAAASVDRIKEQGRAAYSMFQSLMSPSGTPTGTPSDKISADGAHGAHGDGDGDGDGSGEGDGSGAADDCTPQGEFRLPGGGPGDFSVEKYEDEDDYLQIRAQLVAFYEEVEPSKEKSVDRILAKFLLNDLEMMLFTKYGAAPRLTLTRKARHWEQRRNEEEDEQDAMEEQEERGKKGRGGGQLGAVSMCDGEANQQVGQVEQVELSPHSGRPVGDGSPSLAQRLSLITPGSMRGAISPQQFRDEGTMVLTPMCLDTEMSSFWSLDDGEFGPDDDGEDEICDLDRFDVLGGGQGATGGYADDGHGTALADIEMAEAASNDEIAMLAKMEQELGLAPISKMLDSIGNVDDDGAGGSSLAMDVSALAAPAPAPAPAPAKTAPAPANSPKAGDVTVKSPAATVAADSKPAKPPTITSDNAFEELESFLANITSDDYTQVPLDAI
jgi:hypothetical protein